MSPSLRRLMKEAAELSSSPSPHFCASPVSESNLYDWHFTLAGPPAPSPYAEGIYHGRIVLPPTYPLRPPSFRFLTPTGRFEVNREICLSISGHHEESWQPAWGIRTALLAIRSFMDGEAKGQVGGLDVSEEVRREYAVQSRGWCCESCEGGGKSNEVVLGEWREVCKERGVEVEGEEGEKKEEKKDEGGVETSDELQKETVPQSEPEPQPPSIREAPEPQQQPQSQQQSTSSPNPGTESTLNPPAPELQAQPQSQAQSLATQVPAAQPLATHQSSDGPWLDRAIVGVLVALVFMIMKRFAISDLD